MLVCSLSSSQKCSASNAMNRIFLCFYGLQAITFVGHVDEVSAKKFWYGEWWVLMWEDQQWHKEEVGVGRYRYGGTQMVEQQNAGDADWACDRQPWCLRLGSITLARVLIHCYVLHTLWKVILRSGTFATRCYR